MDYLAGIGQYADRAIFPFPAIVVTDLSMSEVSGIDLCRWIRRKNWSLPVVILIGSSWAKEIERAYEAGATLARYKTSNMLEVAKKLQTF